MTIEERDGIIRRAIAMRKEKHTPKRKWEESELNLRREAIYHEMGLGKSYAFMCYDLAERWDCSQSQMQDYIAEARRALSQTAKEGIEEFRTKMTEKLERLAKDAEEHGDRKSMLAAYDQISKLNGAYTTKVEAEVNGDIKFDFGGDK